MEDATKYLVVSSPFTDKWEPQVDSCGEYSGTYDTLKEAKDHVKDMYIQHGPIEFQIYVLHSRAVAVAKFVKEE